MLLQGANVRLESAPRGVERVAQVPVKRLALVPSLGNFVAKTLAKFADGVGGGVLEVRDVVLQRAPEVGVAQTPLVRLVGDQAGDVLLEVGEGGESLVLLGSRPSLRVRFRVDADSLVLQVLVHDKVLELLRGVLERAELATEPRSKVDKLVVDARLDRLHARDVLLPLLLHLVLHVVEDGGAVRGAGVELRLDGLDVHRVQALGGLHLRAQLLVSLVDAVDVVADAKLLSLQPRDVSLSLLRAGQ